MKLSKLALHWQMGIALVLGVICGLLFRNSFNHWGIVIDGIGDLFLHAINMIVIPLVFLSTVLGISKLEGSASMGRIAIKTFLYFITTAVIAALIGVLFAEFLQPGYNTTFIEMEAKGVISSAQEAEQVSFMDKITNIVPSNIFAVFSSGEILPIIFFSMLFGFFITKIQTERQANINNLFESFYDVIMRMTSFIIRFAPIGVFAIVMNTIGQQASNMDSLIGNVKSLAFFVIVVWISLIVMGGIALPIMVGVMAKVSPIKHLRQIYSALMVAFSTSSSYSALPLIISDAKDKMGVSNNIASFTVPLGITFNKIGTIIYECVAVIFVAQAAGIDLAIGQQVSLIGASIVTVLGAPSVPMAGVVVLAILLKAMDLPIEYVGMFMAVDILCDMPKTMLNAYSVSCSAIIVARSEGEILKI